jgi:transposase
MIRSTKISLKFINSGKREQIQKFLHEYRRVAQVYLDEFWKLDKVPRLMSSNIMPKVDTWLSLTVLQCLGKQVSGIIYGTRKKHKQRQYRLNKLLNDGNFTQAQKLQAVMNNDCVGKPNISTINPILDQRCVDIYVHNTKSKLFDGLIHLSRLGDHLILNLPFKCTKHLNKLDKVGKLKQYLRITDSNAILAFDIPDPAPKTSGSTLGIDVGFNSVLTCSNGTKVEVDNHGHTMTSIVCKLSRKVKGSKAFNRVVRHRNNFISSAVKKINFDDVKQINIEKLKLGRNTCRFFSHFSYLLIFARLKNLCETYGVHVHEVTSTYTSQRCNRCGWVHKGNRNGRLFVCNQCGFTSDSDFNAANNIAIDLPKLGVSCLERSNRVGFYWLVPGQESMVPTTLETQ